MPYTDYLRAIRRKCLDCCGGQKNEVEKCPVLDCPLHPYRQGERQNSLLASGKGRGRP